MTHKLFLAYTEKNGIETILLKIASKFTNNLNFTEERNGIFSSQFGLSMSLI